MQNDLGEAANSIYRRWARIFLRTVRQICRNMKQSNIFSFYSDSYHPTNKKLRLRKATKLRRTAEASDTSEAKQPQKLKRKVYKIQFGHAVPKNWKDIICLDTLNGNHK